MRAPQRRFLVPATSLRKVVVTSTHFKPEAQVLASELAAEVVRLGAEVELDLEGTRKLADVAGDADLVLSVGGDGTLLAAARRLMGSHVPVLGVNLGKLGFLAEFDPAEVRAYLAGGSSENWLVSPKMMLEATLEGEPSPRYALNDVMISQGVMTRLLSIDMEVDGLHATQYWADGVVVSTPVGSTSYSLSLGGPILSQGLRAFVITPIAPHSLTNRPIVIEGGSEVAFEVQSPTAELALVFDGQERLDLRRGDRFTVRAAPTDVLLLSPGGRTYYDILRHKLSWGTLPNLRHSAD